MIQDPHEDVAIDLFKQRVGFDQLHGFVKPLTILRIDFDLARHSHRVDHDDDIPDDSLLVGQLGNVVHLSGGYIEFLGRLLCIWLSGSLAKHPSEKLAHLVDGLGGTVATKIGTELP